MKKFAFVFFVAFIIGICSIEAFSLGSQEEIRQKTEESFFSGLDDEVVGILEENGLDTLDAEKIFSKGTENIGRFFSETLRDKLSNALGWFFLLLCALMIMSIVSSMYDFSVTGDAFTLFCLVMIIVLTVGKISSFVSCTVSAVSLNGKLMLCFVPVFTLLVSLSGSPTAALTYSSTVLLFSELMSYLISDTFLSFIGIYFALSLSFSFNSGVNLNRFTNSVNRAVNLLLGFGASMFTGLLSLKSFLAHSTDSLSHKGVKFLLGSLVPVIGPSLSEAYSVILGSINLMKGSLGIVGIFALILINIPALTEGVVYYLLMSLLSCFAEILGLIRVSELLRAIGSCIRVLLLLCLFQVFILIVSVGIMLSLRGGANG